jgi:hypothetical protein
MGLLSVCYEHTTRDCGKKSAKKTIEKSTNYHSAISFVEQPAQG